MTSLHRMTSLQRARHAWLKSLNSWDSTLWYAARGRYMAEMCRAEYRLAVLAKARRDAFWLWAGVLEQ